MRQLKITPSITNRESEVLEKYLQEIGREEMITPEEEVALARRIKEGDHKALEKLTKANLRFVVSVAKKYQNYGISLADLINEGNLGLIKAAEKFDETRGFKFISYAVWWIRQSIMEAIAAQSRIVRMPANHVGSASKINKILNDFEQKNERRPSIDEIVSTAGISEDKILDAIKANSRQISIDAPIADNENSNNLIDLLANDDSRSTDSELIIQSLKEEIRTALGVLNERERNILEAYYGIDQPECTMDEIGKRYDLTRERVRQIREKAIRKLRKNTNNKILKAYLGQ